MIKGSRCTDGTPIKGLYKTSRKYVVRICDSCGKETVIKFCHLNNSRERRGEPKDYCSSCSQKYPYPSTVSPELEVPGPVSRKQQAKIRSEGYIKMRDGSGKHVDHHRLVSAQTLGRDLKPEEQVHHIDGDKKNNDQDNLFVCASRSEHTKIHGQLEELAFQLVKAGAIGFNRKEKKYHFNHDLKVLSMPQSLEFDQVQIEQTQTNLYSRKDVSTKSEIIKGVFVDVPIICSNMSTVSDPDFCIKLNKLGGLGVLHRAYKNNDTYARDVAKIAAECEHVAASVGVKEGQFDLCKKLIKSGANIIFVDVAHGYANYVMELGREIKNNFPSVKLVLGNTTNLNMLFDTYRFIDALKVGIGSGLACTTRFTAGCYEGQFSAVRKFKDHSKVFGIPIISDGGVRKPMDFTKAIAAGANSAMAGSIFAACPESAAPLIDGKKAYSGMASRAVQEEWHGYVKNNCPEGKTVMLDVGESLDKLIERYKGALCSGMTYANSSNIQDFQNKVKFIRV